MILFGVLAIVITVAIVYTSIFYYVKGLIEKQKYEYARQGFKNLTTKLFIRNRVGQMKGLREDVEDLIETCTNSRIKSKSENLLFEIDTWLLAH